MGPHFLAFSGKLSVNRQEKKQGMFSEYIEAHMQNFRHFQAKKIDQKKSLRGLSTSLFKCCLHIEWSKTD